MNRIPVASVVLTLVEGPSNSPALNKAITFDGGHHVYRANQRLNEWAQGFARNMEGGLKVQVLVTFDSGRKFHMNATINANKTSNIMQELANEVNMYAGISKPAHLTQEQVDKWRTNHLSKEDIEDAVYFSESYAYRPEDQDDPTK